MFTMCLADGVTVCAFVLCCWCWCGLCWFARAVCCWRENGRVLALVCRYIFIYWWHGAWLWRVLVLVWACWWFVLYVWMYARFVSCGVGVYMYLCIMRLWFVWWLWWCGGDGLLVCDIYNGGSLVFSLVCIYRMICHIQKSNNFHA